MRRSFGLCVYGYVVMPEEGAPSFAELRLWRKGVDEAGLHRAKELRNIFRGTIFNSKYDYPPFAAQPRLREERGTRSMDGVGGERVGHPAEVHPE